jgi:AcrR family transcriptional regulator
MTYSQASTHASLESRSTTDVRRPADALLADGITPLESSAPTALRARRDRIRDRKVESVRAAVAEQALGLLLSSGFTSTTVDDIAKHSGVGRRTFFRYFETKEAVVLWHLERFGVLAAQATLARPDDEALFQAACEGLCEASALYSDSAQRTREILRLVEATPSLFAQYAVQTERFKAALASALARRIHGEPDDLACQLVARVSLEGFHTALRRWLATPDVSLEACVSDAFSALRATLS